MSLERESSMTWVEPFVGSAKVISLVGGHRIGSDVNHEMIALFKALQNGYEPPGEVSEEFYNEVKQNQDQYPDHLKAFISIGCAFSAKRWSTYARNNRGNNYALDAKNSLNRLRPLIENVEFLSSDYKDLKVPSNSLIYCDPPYKGTTGYGFHFDHEEFYQWCRDKVKQGHLVFVSEYQAPEDFECVWSKRVSVSAAEKKVSYKEEKLFRVHKPKNFSLRMY